MAPRAIEPAAFRRRFNVAMDELEKLAMNNPELARELYNEKERKLLKKSGMKPNNASEPDDSDSERSSTVSDECEDPLTLHKVESISPADFAPAFSAIVNQCRSVGLPIDRAELARVVGPFIKAKRLAHNQKIDLLIASARNKTAGGRPSKRAREESSQSAEEETGLAKRARSSAPLESATIAVHDAISTSNVAHDEQAEANIAVDGVVEQDEQTEHGKLPFTQEAERELAAVSEHTASETTQVDHFPPVSARTAPSGFVGRGGQTTTLGQQRAATPSTSSITSQERGDMAIMKRRSKSVPSTTISEALGACPPPMPAHRITGIPPKSLIEEDSTELLHLHNNADVLAGNTTEHIASSVVKKEPNSMAMSSNNPDVKFEPGHPSQSSDQQYDEDADFDRDLLSESTAWGKNANPSG